jgi:hypothetical protein
VCIQRTSMRTRKAWSTRVQRPDLVMSAGHSGRRNTMYVAIMMLECWYSCWDDACSNSADETKQALTGTDLGRKVAVCQGPCQPFHFRRHENVPSNIINLTLARDSRRYSRIVGFLYDRSDRYICHQREDEFQRNLALNHNDTAEHALESLMLRTI